MMKYFKFLPILLLTIATACSPKEKEIVILTTNDIHGKLEGFAKAAVYANEMRKLHSNVLLINAGDMFSGNPIVDQHAEKGYPIIDIMNKLGYRLTTIGNHEFDYGQEALAKRIEQSSFPWISANIKVGDGAHILQPEPFVRMDIDGVKVVFLGLTQVEKNRGYPSTHPDRIVGISFTNPVEEALNYKHLRSECDVFIALTHIGVEADVELAERMPELDLIIGGHSHTKIAEEMVVNGVLITQTESWISYLGKTTLVVKGGKLVSKKNELVSVKDMEKVDEDVLQLIKGYVDASGMGTVVGENLTAIDTRDRLGYLMTDAIVQEHKVDMAFQNRGGVRIEHLDAGDITIAKVYELDPFGNEVVVFKMTPAQIRELVSYASQTHARGGVDLFASGIRYTIAKSDGSNQVTLALPNGTPLDEKKQYLVGMNSYIASAYKFSTSTEGQSLFVTSAETLISYLQRVKKVDYSKEEDRAIVR